jgi:predicted regulator of Ras-like GTPase activity (Roadblock/LC7/MglB family)
LSYPSRRDLDWLVTVSADGVPLALSADIPAESAEHLAAITSGLASLMDGAARIFEAGRPTQALVEMEGGLMLVKSISDGSCLAVLASTECDTELVSYEMTLLVEAVGEALTPAVRSS